MRLVCIKARLYFIHKKGFYILNALMLEIIGLELQWPQAILYPHHEAPFQVPVQNGCRMPWQNNGTNFKSLRGNSFYFIKVHG